MTILATVGCSHAGKSFYSDKWKKEPTDKSRIVVTTDNIRKAITGKVYSKEAETIVFAHKHIMLKTLLLEGYDEILVCGTHTSFESIKRILEIDWNAKFIVFDTPLDVCIERTKLTGQTWMVPVIKRHHYQLQKLLDEGLDNVVKRIKLEIEYRWNKGGDLERC